MEGRTRPATLAVLAGLMLTLVVPAPAHAAVARLNPSTVLEVFDVGGETNDVTVSSTGATLLVTEAGAPLTAGTGCATAGPNQVSCPASGVTSIVVWTGDLDDEMAVTAALPAALHGEDGNDLLTGGPGNDDLNGGSGSDWVSYFGRTAPLQVHMDGFPNDGGPSETDNVRTDVENVIGGMGADFINGGPGANEIRAGDGADSLTGGGGPDVLLGEGGDDALSGGAGGDSMGGGAGADTVTYAGRANPVSADLDGVADDGEAGEGDAIATDVENIIGGDAPDTLIANAAANVLTGGPGGDTLDAGGGPDVVAGEGGNDTVFARDATTDQLSCGADIDVATVDPHDALTGCESADAGLAGPPPPPDTTVPLEVPTDAGAAPRVRLPKGPLRMTRRGVIRLRVTCPAGGGDCRGNVVVRLLPKRAARAAASRGRPVVARGRVRLAAGKTGVVTVRASRNGRRRVLRRRRARCSVAVVTTDAQGHRTRSVRTITIKAQVGKAKP